MIFITRLHGSQLIVGEFLDSGLVGGWPAPDSVTAPGASPHPGSVPGPAPDRTTTDGAPSAEPTPAAYRRRGRFTRGRRGGDGP